MNLVPEKMGYPGYFLIVADFIKWAKNRVYPLDQAGVLVLVRWLPLHLQ